MQSIALIGIISLLSAVSILHLGVLIGIFPRDWVWGNRIQTKKQILLLEMAALVISFIFIWITLQFGQYIHPIIPKNELQTIIGIMGIFFAFNTLGNLMSKNKFERYIFTPLSTLLVCFCNILYWGIQ